MTKNNLKILFINPPFYRLTGKTYIYIPLGICSLAAVTKEAGYETFVYNMDVPPVNSELYAQYQREYQFGDERDLILLNLEKDPIGVWKELEETLKDIKPDVIAISALTPQAPTAKKVAKICKLNNPEAKIIIGGPHATLRPKELIEEDVIDYVFSGEGENGILEFLTAVKNKASLNELRFIDGLSYKTDRGIFLANNWPLIDTEKYPMPAMDLFVFPERLQPKNMGFVMTGRGCYFRCKFCASPTLAKHTVRKKSSDRLVYEIEHIMKSYGTTAFMFWEDTFINSKARIEEFCNLLKNRKIDISWRCHTRLDTLNKDILDLMSAGGCKQVNVGIETGSQKMLKYLNKRMSLAGIIEKMELLRNSGIAWSANFMIGYPEETIEDIEETVDFIATHVKNHIAANICIPYPGTTFFDDCKTMGIIKEPIDWTLFFPKSRYAGFSKYVSSDLLYDYLRKLERISSPYYSASGAFSPCERD